MATLEGLKGVSAGSRGSQKYVICGVEVEFPYKPYGPQLAYMGKVLAALEQSRVKRTGSVNALLESPTGSGKTLALLCATLAWQKQFESMPSLPPAVVTNPLVGGGGFIIEDSPSGPENERAHNPVAGPPTGVRSNKQAPKKRKVPIIYYATRTHSQITQVIREFRKTNYRVSMAVLAARKHYCTNKHVVKKKNVDEDCKILLKDVGSCCPQFKNVTKLRTHASLQKGGINDVHDIEDLVGLGHKVKGCAYFAARALATEADIVFCPYSYILDPIIRSAMEVNLQGAIIVLDEAHNIEDVAREAGSTDLETNLLQDLRLELEQLTRSEETADIYTPLLDMVQAMLDWIFHQETSLSKLDFEHYASSWRGDKALQELRAAGICLETFQVLIDCSDKAVAAASNPDETVNHLSGRAAVALEGLFSALKFMLLNNGRQAGDYQLVVKRYVKRDEGLAVAGWVTMFSLWCLNPGVVFEDIASASRSIILTSGTLSPMDSFASELGVPFEIQMEAPHVVDMDKQVWAAAVSTGPGNISLNASYKNADGYAFQDALGIVLEEVFKVVPDGALAFFPSYKLLDKVCARWKSTGQWFRLSSQKELFVEPRGNNDQFEQILQDFYNSVNVGGRISDNSIKEGARKNREQKKRNTSPSLRRLGGGAAFFAVCRGKVSEGIDFSDRNARIVVIIGIPFPNVKDIQVTLKKQYNQENRVHKNLLSGDQWYCQQTFRALNQAVGRCIRHRNDYGAILLLDDRFKKPGNIEYMSKWLRKSIRQCESFKQSLEGLQTFFKGFETSLSDREALRIVPTVKSTLISSHKVKLLTTPSSGRPDSQRNLKGYITKVQVNKASPAVDQGLKESATKLYSCKDQISVTKDSKAVPEREPRLPSAQQSRKVDEPESTRSKVRALKSPGSDIAKQTYLEPVTLEEADSDYEVFSLRNDHIPWADQTAMSDVDCDTEGEYIGVDDNIMEQCDDLQLTQPPIKTANPTVTSSGRVELEVAKSIKDVPKEASSREGPVVCVSGREKEHIMESLAPGKPELAKVHRHCVQLKDFNSPGLILRSLSSASWLETPAAEISTKRKDTIGLERKHGPQFSHHVAFVDLTNDQDSETHTCCKDIPENGRISSHATKLRISHCEELSESCMQSEGNGGHDGGPDDLRDREHEVTPLRPRNILSWMEDSNPQMNMKVNTRVDPGGQGDGGQFEGHVVRERDKTGMPSIREGPSVDLYSCLRQETHFPAHETDVNNFPRVDSKWEHPVPVGDRDSLAMDCSEQTSDVEASCTRRDQKYLEFVLSCERCSCAFSNPTKLCHKTFSKSHLVTIANAAGVARAKESEKLSVSVLTMDFVTLDPLLIDNLSALKVSSSSSSPMAGLRDSQSCGVWVKEDGCVYEKLFCPRCDDHSNCVGVHIAATDKANVSLMDKVVFFEKCVKVKNFSAAQIPQSTSEKHKDMFSFLPTPAVITKDNQSASKRARAATPARSKLKLHRTKL